MDHDDRVAPGSQPEPGTGDTFKCPKCGAPRARVAEECGTCGIVFRKWYAHQEGRQEPSPSPSEERGDGKSPAALIVSTAAVLLVAAGLTWALLPEGDASVGSPAHTAVPLGDDLVVTYVNGDKCRLSDWRFVYRRKYNKSYTQGMWQVIDLRGHFEVKTDRTLRIYDARDRKLAFGKGELREIRIYSEPESDTGISRKVTGVTVVATSEDVKVPPRPSPNSYRSRFLVPVAPHYFPGKLADDPSKWRSATVSLEGTLSPGCGGSKHIGLTDDEHPTHFTPIRIEFPGA